MDKNKHIIVIAIIALIVFPLTAHSGFLNKFIKSNISTEYPLPYDNYVNDFGGLISETTENDLRHKLHNFEDQYGIEFVIATINSYKEYKTGASTWEGFSKGLFNLWGIGNLPENNGMLLLISESDRKVRVQLGSGCPENFTDVAKQIIDNDITPYLSSNDYDTGISTGAELLMSEFPLPNKGIGSVPWGKGFATLLVFSCLAALYAHFFKKSGAIWWALGGAGFLFFWLLEMFSDDFGGGSSDGDGASGDF